MGCDIHAIAEVRRGGRWLAVTEAVFKGWGDEPTTEPFSDRNYEAFAILAGVRNRYGVRPIAEPRGLPKDASTETLRLLSYDDPDLHTRSWLTLAELESHDWTATIELSGVQDEATYKAGRKYPYSAGVSGGSVVVLDEADYPPRERDDKAHYYVERRWTETHAEVVGSLYSQTLSALRSLSDDPRDVRMVFAFDN